MTTLRRILVPVDFTPGSLAAVRHARDLAALFGSHVHVIHVASDNKPPAWAIELFGGDYQRLTSQGRLDALDRLATMIATERLDPFATTGVVRDGSAEDAIAEYAFQIDADLIVMGVHGDHIPADDSVGQVMTSVLTHVRCPVLAIPEENAAIAVVGRELPQEVAC
jgi:nucleotide-binding universal stress UspA family protein